MHDRYKVQQLADLFGYVGDWQSALDVELAVIDARAQLGEIPKAHAKKIRQLAPRVDNKLVAAIKRREKITEHDVAAFVDVVQKRINDPVARYFHQGLTSSDVIDTALALRLVKSMDFIIPRAEGLLVELCIQARRFAATPTAGRTHGQHAEIITFGVRLANWAMMVDRALNTLKQAREEIRVGKLSGACGTYTNISPQVELLVCDQLGLVPIMATQVLPRDLHAHLVYACTRLANAIGVISFNLRIMASTEYGEVEEGRRPRQKGSSAMPHKRNPIKTEQLDGFARKVRGELMSALQQVELLFERDISHSAPERMTLPDVVQLTAYMAVTLITQLGRLVVKPERMQLNIDRMHGLVFTQTVLSALIDAGWQRDPAYYLIQELAFAAIDRGVNLRELLEADERVNLSANQLDVIFDQEAMLRNIPIIIDRLPQ